MKKRKLTSSVCFLILIPLLVLSGCKSSPKEEPEPVEEVSAAVDPLDLLDGGNSFFLSMTPDADPELIARIIQQNVSGITQSQTDILARTLLKVCAGFTRTRDTTSMQIAAAGKFPVKKSAMLFSEKSGWTASAVAVTKENADDKLYPFFTRNDGLEASFPSASCACFGSDVKDMILRYDEIASGAPAQTGMLLKNDARSWLSDTGNEIRFYADKPQSFLTILTGTSLNWKLYYVKGSMVCDSSYSGQYLLTIEFEFKDPRTIPAAQGMLSLAFGLTDSEMKLDTPSHLTVYGIKINKKQLYRLLAL